MRYIAAVAGFVFTCVAGAALAAEYPPAPANIHAASLGKRTLTATELYAFLYGRTVQNVVPGKSRSFIHTFNADGTVTTEPAFAKPWTGIWRVGESGLVTLIWNGHGSAVWGASTDGSGRYFHSK